MAFTRNDDVNILQSSDSATVGADVGNDTYILSGDFLRTGQLITITDSLGSNKLQLVGGLSITSTSVTSNAVLLTLSNGAKITLLGADTFGYLVSGDSLTGSGGTTQTFSEFVTTTLGLAAVPLAGAATPTAGTAKIIASTTPTPTTAPAAYTIVASETGSITEGNTVTFTVTPTAAITTTTTLTYQVSGAIVGAVAAGSSADYSPSSGSITFSAGETSKTFSITATNDGTSEGLEGFKVNLLDSSFNVKASANIVFTDGASSGQTFALTTGSDLLSSFTGTSGNDVFNAGDIAAAAAWTTGDAIDGAGGTGDTFNIISAAAITKPVSATVSNIEIINATSGATVTLDTTSGFSGLTTLNTTGVGGATITAATTTDISVTDSAMSTTTDDEILINGGKNITATLTAADSTTDADATAEIVIGSTAVPVGIVTVNLTGKYTDGTSNTMSNIAITGGSTASVTTATGLTNTQLLAQTTDTTNFTITQSAVAITGGTATTAATVTQAAAVAEVKDATIGKIGIKNGAVTINDTNRASTSSAGTIATVTLNNYGDSTINSGALSTVNLSGTGGTLGITTGALTTPVVSTLALSVNGLSYKNAGSNNAITVDSDIATLNITSSTAASTVNNITASGATTVSVAGNAMLTMTNNTFAAATAINVTNTAGVVFGTTAIGANTAFAGGAGADSIILTSGFTKAITMGDGNDTVTYQTKGTGGSVAAGNGSADKIIMTSAQAETGSGVSGGTDFNTNFTGFEVLELSNALAAGNTVNVVGVNSASKVILTAGGSDVSTAIISNLASGGTVQTNANSTGFVVQVKDAGTNTSDVLNLGLSKNGILAAGTITAASVETIAISTADAATATDATTGSDAAIHTLTLAATSATSVTVTGNNGLTLTNTGNIAITNFDASGVSANNTATTDSVLGTTDTAANLAVTFASETTTSGATVTIKGGAGNDVLTGNGLSDSITGNAGADTLVGAAGADTLTAGEGTDSVTGGADSDAIILTETTSAADIVVLNAVVGTSSDSGRSTVAGNDNDIGADTITGFTFGTDVIKVIATSVASFVHGTDTMIGTATGSVDNGTQGSFLTTVGLIELNQGTNNTFTDSGDIAITFASPSVTMTETLLEAALQYNITGAGTADTITTGDLADTIDGAAGADVIDGGAGADTITGGAAADSITGGTGADTIVWTATAAAAFATETGATAGTDNDFAAGTVGDKVVGFTSTSDVLKFAAAAVTNATGTEVDTLLVIAAGGTVTNVARFVHVNTTVAEYATAGDMGNAITILNALTTSAVAVGDSFIAFIDNDTSTDIFYVKQVSAADTIAAQDVTLIGQLTGTATIATGDVVSF